VNDTAGTDARIYKEEVVTGTGASDQILMKREIFLDGNHDLVFRSADGSVFTRIFCTKDEVKVTYKDVNVIKINTDQINLSKGGDPTINMNSSGIQAKFGAAEVNLSGSSAETKYSIHYCRVHSGGVDLG
jgi:hypothetical protein